MRFHSKMLLPFLLAATSAVVYAQPPASLPQASAFLAEINAHFDAWDADHNGELTKSELDKLIADAHTTGSSAAAIVALRRSLTTKTYPAPQLTRANITHLVETEKPGVTTAPNYDSLFKAALTKITTYNRELFATGVPKLDMLHQGRLGDCFCLAPLGAMIHRDPQQVVHMFTPQKDGDYQVQFGSGSPVTMHSLTDAEIALSSTSRGDGTWVNMYEKAVGLYTIQNRPAPKASPSNTAAANSAEQADPSFLDVIGKGGSAGKVISIITGHSTRRFSCSPWHQPAAAVPAAPAADKPAESTSTPPPATAQTPAPAVKRPAAPPLTPEEKLAKLANLREMLTTAIKEKKLICAGTPATGLKPPGISLKHAYAILDYDASRDILTVWNPHGNTFHPKGDPGLTNGYVTEKGQFEVPLPEALTFFSGIVFETDQSAPPPRSAAAAPPAVPASP